MVLERERINRLVTQQGIDLGPTLYHGLLVKGPLYPSFHRLSFYNANKWWLDLGLPEAWKSFYCHCLIIAEIIIRTLIVKALTVKQEVNNNYACKVHVLQ